MENIRKVKGVIESFGQGTSMGDINAKLNLVIKTEDGQLQTFKTIGALGIVGNYIQTGMSGTFHIISVGGKLDLLIAIERDDGTKISDIEAFEKEYKQCKGINSGGNFLIFLGILTLPLLLFGVIVLVKAAQIKGFVKPFLAIDPGKLKEYLIEEDIIKA